MVLCGRFPEKGYIPLLESIPCGWTNCCWKLKLHDILSPINSHKITPFSMYFQYESISPFTPYGRFNSILQTVKEIKLFKFSLLHRGSNLLPLRCCSILLYNFKLRAIHSLFSFDFHTFSKYYL